MPKSWVLLVTVATPDQAAGRRVWVSGRASAVRPNATPLLIFVVAVGKGEQKCGCEREGGGRAEVAEAAMIHTRVTFDGL